MNNFYATWLRLLLLLLLLAVKREAQAQAPAWQWASTPGIGVGNVTTVDALGNTYVAGYFWGTATFGTTILTNSGVINGFVAKLSPAGAYLWAVSIGGNTFDGATGIAVSAGGDVYVSGFFNSSTITVGSTVLTNAGGPFSGGSYTPDMFVGKLTSSGSWQWVVGMGGTGIDFTSGIAVDASGTAFVSGEFRSPTVTFGTTTLTNTRTGTSDGFVAQLTSAGAWQWAARTGGIRDEVASDVAMDASGNAYVSGRFASSTVAFGATTLVNSAGGSDDGFVAKLNPAGVWQWAVKVGGIGQDRATRVTVDVSGNPYVCGEFNSSTIAFGSTVLTNSYADSLDAFVAELDSAGRWQWATGIGGTGAYVAGEFTSLTLPIGSAVLTNIHLGTPDIFVAKLTPTGAWQWAVGVGSTGDDSMYGIAAGGGSICVTGLFSGPSITFGSTAHCLNPG